MLQTQTVRLLLHLSLFWCICCGLSAGAELKAVTERMARSSEDLNNNTQSEFYIRTLKLALVKLETEISRLKEINEEKAETKQLKSDLNDLKLKYFEVQNNLTECQKSKNKKTPGIVIKGLREQMLEDIKSENWSRSAELIKKHVDNSTLVYEQVNNITQLYSRRRFYSYPLRAAENGYRELIQVMLDNGLPINKRFGYAKSTMLHSAAFGHYDLVKFLLQQGAEVNVRRSYGPTPLHSAAACCDVNIVQLLLDSGADINDTDNNGDTPLHEAAKWRCESMIQYLINKGCDTTMKNKKGETAADINESKNKRK